MIRFDQVSFGYDRGPLVLEGVTLHVEPGSFHFVVGASGAGKTSLLRLLYLGAKPTAGRVVLAGRDVARLSRRERAHLRRRIGVVFQDYRLFENLTVFENVALPLRIAGETEEEVRDKANELLSWVGLAEALDSYPPSLSGGEQQRVAVARAVITNPDLLIADEPTGNLDDRMAERLLRLFDELHRVGTTVLIATHNEQLVRRLGHPQLRVGDGQVVAEGPHGPPPFAD